MENGSARKLIYIEIGTVTDSFKHFRKIFRPVWSDVCVRKIAEVNQVPKRVACELRNRKRLTSHKLKVTKRDRKKSRKSQRKINYSSQIILIGLSSDFCRFLFVVRSIYFSTTFPVDRILPCLTHNQ